MTILHLALFVGQLMFAAVAYYLVSGGLFPGDQTLDGIFKIVAPVVALSGFLGSNIFHKTQLKSIHQKPALKDKLKGYQSALLLKWALLEVPALFSLVCFLLTGSYFFLGLAALVMVLFLMSRPTPGSAGLDLELSPADRKCIEDPSYKVTD